MRMSEMVKHCVLPPCSNWPGATRRSTTSPEIGADHWNFGGCWPCSVQSGLGNADDTQRLLCGFQVGLRLHFGGLGRLEVTLGDGMMRVEILGARVVLVREGVDVALP